MINPSQLQVLASQMQVPATAAPMVRLPRRARSAPAIADVVIRHARSRDARSIRDLEALDSHALGEGERLVAEVDGLVVAAIAVADDTVAADPFEHTANVSALLRIRARQLRAAATPKPAPRLALIQRLAR